MDEDLIIDSAQSCLRLESDLGPLQPKFRGKFTWRPSVNKMDFAFSEAEVGYLQHTMLENTCLTLMGLQPHVHPRHAPTLEASWLYMQVLLFGRSVFRRQVGFKEKTYTFFWLRDGVACARSSGGTLTLLHRLLARARYIES